MYGKSPVICATQAALFLFPAAEQRSYGEKVLATLEAEASIFVNVAKTGHWRIAGLQQPNRRVERV